MEYCNQITWIVIGKDRNKKFSEQNIILLDNTELITKQLLYGDVIVEELKKLSDEYLKYNEKFVSKELVDINSINENGVISELVYLSVVNYIPNLNKKGTFYTLEEIETRDILIHERYGKHIRRKCSSLW